MLKKRRDENEPADEDWHLFLTRSSKEKKLDAASTLDIDRKVWRCTTELQDHKQLAKLAAGDMVAIEVHYHLNCLISFYDQARQIN